MWLSHSALSRSLPLKNLWKNIRMNKQKKIQFSLLNTILSVLWGPLLVNTVFVSFLACLNFLKLCKIKYYNYCLFHSVQVSSLPFAWLFIIKYFILYFNISKSILHYVTLSETFKSVRSKIHIHSFCANPIFFWSQTKSSIKRELSNYENAVSS